MPTVIVEEPVSVEYDSEMQDVSFKCSATTDDSTPLEYYWSHYLELEDDRYRLYPENNDRVTVNNEGAGSELILQLKDVSKAELDEQYKGFYVCTATNKYSTKHAAAELVVKGVPPVGKYIFDQT